ncbi:MAG: aspartate aminotransferase family protein [Christensenellales bacterium]|jgi:acetylornithine/N-succinyldiaminopimelate aminotransferase
MQLAEIQALDRAYYMNTFGERIPVCFVRGEGCTLYDTAGKAYTDLFAGIAVNALGYAHPALTAALREQIGRLTHTSSVYYVESQAVLARMLVENSFADRVFFCNTGAEANEGAVKLARKYFYERGEKRYRIITLQNSFHGRTLAMVAATGQEKYQKPYHPLPAGFVNVPAYDIAAMREAVDSETAAVMLETVQGEGGVHPGSTRYLQAVADLCREKGALLIIDEIQTGLGRTGKLFGYQHHGITPDIITLAKALGGGIPIGAILASGEVASAFHPGDHGTTFGGNPLSCTAGITVLTELLGGVLDSVAPRGEYLTGLLAGIARNQPAILEVRGQGLMIGVALQPAFPARDIVLELLKRGFVAGTAAGNTLRLTPPLIITERELDAFAAALDDTLSQYEVKPI